MDNIVLIFILAGALVLLSKPLLADSRRTEGALDVAEPRDPAQGGKKS